MKAHYVGRVFALGRARLQHRIIDADVFALGIKFFKLLIESRRSPGGRDLFQVRSGLRKMLPQGIGERAGAPHKNTAVPVIVAGCNEFFRALKIGLFSKALHAEQLAIQLVSGLNVPVSGFRAARLDAHGHNVLSLAGDLHGAEKQFLEFGFIANNVVRREHANNRSGIEFFQEEGCQPYGRRSVAGLGLNYYLFRWEPGQLAAYFGSDELIGDDPKILFGGHWGQPLNGLLDHCLFSVEGQHLLGGSAPAAGPEPRPAASGKDYRIKLVFSHSALEAPTVVSDSTVLGCATSSAGNDAHRNSNSHCGVTTNFSTDAGTTTASPQLKVTGPVPSAFITPQPP